MAHTSIQDKILSELSKNSPLYTADLVKAVGMPKRQVTDNAAHVRAKGLITSNRANIGTPCRYAITNAGRIKMGMAPVDEVAVVDKPKPAIRKYGADLQQQGYFFLPRDKAIVEAIAIDMNEGFTSANAPYIRDRYLPQRLAVNNPESVTEKGQPHGRDV